MRCRLLHLSAQLNNSLSLPLTQMIDPSPAALSEELAGRVWEESDKQTRRIVSEYEQNIN